MTRISFGALLHLPIQSTFMCAKDHRILEPLVRIGLCVWVQLFVWNLLAALPVFHVRQVNAGSAVKESRRVLVFYEAGFSYPGIALIDREIRAAMEQSPYHIELYSETLEELLLPDELSQRDMRAAYIRKYRDHKPDLIIAEGGPPIKFMVDSHDEYFRDVPIVFCGAWEEPAGYPPLGADFTGTWMSLEPQKTLDVALQLQPSTKHVVVVGGVSSFDRILEHTVREQMGNTGQLDVSYLTNLTMPKLLNQVSRLQNDSIVLFTDFSEDADGRLFVGTTQVLPAIVAVANAPVFVIADSQVGRGAVGGYLASFRDQGRIAGATAVRILQGAKPHDIPITKAPNVYTFDWEALQHWRLKQSKLPPVSIVLNRQPGFWQLYKQYVLIAIVALLAQTFAILCLLWQRAQRRKAQAELIKSEEKFSKAFQRSPLAFTLTSLVDFRFVEVNDTFERYTGWKRNEIIGRTPLEINFWVNISERSSFIEQLRAKRAVLDMEILFRTKNGQMRTGLLCSELIDLNGELCALSLLADITDRKLAEEAVADVGRRLIQAHEEERTRIARELHDDINQRIAVMTVELEQCQQNRSDSGADGCGQVRHVCQRLVDLGKDVQSLSHRLHSSKLEYLGLVVAARSFCKELSEQHKVEINFSHRDVPHDLPKDISLCLFRILQEALQNAVKYSGVRHFTVDLRGSLGEMQLTVNDLGVGFDQKDVMTHKGLGLISMRERIQLVKGEFSIQSERGGGTTIQARVPFKVTEHEARAG